MFCVLTLELDSMIAKRTNGGPQSKELLSY